MKAKQFIVLFFVTLGILVENVNTSPISDDNFKRAIFDQWPNLHLGLDALSNQKILNGVLCILKRICNLFF